MKKQQTNFHGSDLSQIALTYHIKEEDILNFSSNVHPLGISPKLKEAIISNANVVATYPDREYLKLRESIGKYLNVSPSSILVGNGATELISLFLQNHSHKPMHGLILGPTYSEYEREILLGGGQVSYFFLKEEDNFMLQTTQLIEHLHQCKRNGEEIDLLILCNPNNPTSSSISIENRRQLLRACRDLKITVIIDETYVEFTSPKEEASSIPLIKEYENLIILRGISKFFAAPGLRLGYAVTTNQTWIEKMKQTQNPWSVNSLAEVGGTWMFQDFTYQKKVLQFIIDERKRVLDKLKTMSQYQFYPPTANFILLKIRKKSITATDVFHLCMEQGMMIRNCSSFQGLNGEFIRFCLQRPQDNDRLLHLLETI